MKKLKGLLYGKRIEKFEGGSPGIGLPGQWRATRLNTGNGQWSPKIPGPGINRSPWAQPGMMDKSSAPNLRGMSPNEILKGSKVPGTSLPGSTLSTQQGPKAPGTGSYSDFTRRFNGKGWGYNPPTGGGGNLPATTGGGGGTVLDHKGWTPEGQRGLPGTSVEGKPTPGNWAPKFDIEDAKRARVPFSTAGGLSPLAGFGMGAGLVTSAIQQIGPHFNMSKATTADPQYNTTSTTGDYTQNAYPGQQVGTGMNIGTQPEYMPDFRYGEATGPFQGYGQRQQGTVNGEEVSAYPNNRIGIKNHLTDAAGSVGNFVMAPFTGFANLMGKQYNDSRLDVPAKNTEASTLKPTEVGVGGPGGDQTNVQQGAIQHQNMVKIASDKVGKADWQFQDDVIAGDVLGIDIADQTSVKKLQSFLADSNFDIGEFGAGGVDGKFGDMTRGATRNFGNLITSDKGINQLKQDSPHLRQMWQMSAVKAGRGATQEQINQQFRADVTENISKYSGDEGTNQALATGTQGRDGKSTMGYGVEAVQQGNNTSDKDAYEKSSNQGNKSYKDKDGKEQKTGKQGSTYKKKKPIVKTRKTYKKGDKKVTKKTTKSSGDTYKDGRNKKEFNAAYRKAKASGATSFKFSNGKSYSTK